MNKMRVALVLVLAIVSLTQAVEPEELLNEEWKAFMLEHGKKYNNQTEERSRMEIFKENRHEIAKHNQKYAKQEVSYKLGLNKYADMLHHEIRETMNGFNYSMFKSKRESVGLVGNTFVSPAHLSTPQSVDWREIGAVTAVKDQGKCGSCWAFSTTGALESHHYFSTGMLVSLSEQNLMDCSIMYGNSGCDGGVMDNAFSYIHDNGGIDTEESYPYHGSDGWCHFHRSSVGATDTGFTDIPEGDEISLMQAVATSGPVSVAIDASHQSFQLYSGGVYNEPKCDAQNLDHGVLVVGYGTDDEGRDFWIVKNSWGSTWGEEGYIRMSRNKNNQCGIATAASYPRV